MDSSYSIPFKGNLDRRITTPLEEAVYDAMGSAQAFADAMEPQMTASGVHYLLKQDPIARFADGRIRSVTDVELAERIARMTTAKGHPVAAMQLLGLAPWRPVRPIAGPDPDESDDADPSDEDALGEVQPTMASGNDARANVAQAPAGPLGHHATTRSVPSEAPGARTTSPNTRRSSGARAQGNRASARPSRSTPSSWSRSVMRGHGVGAFRASGR